MIKRLCMILFCLAGLCSCKQTVQDNFELSYWIDINLDVNRGRGYWKDYRLEPESSVPDEVSIDNACSMLSGYYAGTRLYLVYNRQFELDSFKSCICTFKQKADKYGLEIIPTFVLECYQTPSTMNFTDNEIIGLCQWCRKTLGCEKFGIYDVYIRQEPQSPQDLQMAAMKEALGDVLIRVGLQPGEHLNDNCLEGVEDTWTAECQGITNELWSNPVEHNGTNKYGRLLLEEWIKERVDGEDRRIVFDMIPVAWDYDKPVDEYHYGCPGDDAKTNDPTLPGRIELCHQAILSCYPEGMMVQKWGGYSCDLHILEANSSGKPESPTFYQQICKKEKYTGYFAPAIDQVAELFNKIKKLK